MLDLAENSQHAVLRMVDDLDDAAAMTNAVLFLGFVDAQQDAVAEAGGFAGLRLARNVDADFRRGPVRLLVPFVGVAMRSPSLSRAVTSASTVEGSAPA